MSMTDHWNEIGVSTGATCTFTVPRAVPAGSLLAISVGRGGAGVVTAIAAVRGNAWLIDGAGAHSTNTFTGCLATMRVSTALVAGDTFVVTAGATSNRWALSAGVFNDVIFPANRTVATPLSTAQPEPDAGPTSPDLAVPRALVLTAVAMTGAGSPITNKVNAIADQVVTTVGSGDRGCALLYKYEGGYVHTGSYKVTASSSSVGITAAYQSNDLPAGTIPYMTDLGEVPGVLSYWDGAVEHPVVSLELAP